MRYHWLVIGAGLFGTTFARKMTDAGKKVLVYEKNDHVGGHCYTKNINGIMVHMHGQHTFHCGNKEIWDFVNRFGEFNQIRPKVLAYYGNRIYSLPFNMMTFNQLWGCTTPQEARQKIEEQRIKIEDPQNLEEYALSTLGRDIYEIFIKHYSQKQWGRSCKDLPLSLVKRMPLRFSFDDCYWSNARWGGIPINGYTDLMQNMLQGIDVQFNVDFVDQSTNIAEKILYTGPIDKFFDYKYGSLEYRTIKFKTIEVEGDFQGALQINHTDEATPYTRTIEHKYFYSNPEECKKSIVTFEYPEPWDVNKEPYYPINDDRNNAIYKKYQAELENYPNVIVGGRLGDFKYQDMDQVIVNSFDIFKRLVS
jgi:UDP-galactopyranose mutase